jgi:Mce-associated membrane protein
VEAAIPAEATETVEAKKTKLVTKPRRRLRMPTLPTIAKVAAILLIIAFTGLSGFVAWKHHESTQRVHRAAAFEAEVKLMTPCLAPAAT